MSHFIPPAPGDLLTPATLKAWRYHLGYQQDELARLLGRSLHTYIKWENGINPMRASVQEWFIERLHKLAPRGQASGPSPPASDVTLLQDLKAWFEMDQWWLQESQIQALYRRLCEVLRKENDAL